MSLESPRVPDEVSYEDFVMRLAKSPQAIIQSLTPDAVHAWHMATGVSGEAGELLDAVKKHALYNKPLDRENVVEELGDLKFYVTGLMVLLNITQEEVEAHNRAKLAKRYAGLQYSDKAAQDRADKVATTILTVSQNFIEPPIFWVNGNMVCDSRLTSVTYEEIVSYARMQGTPSITYQSKREGDHREGIMSPGRSIDDLHGLMFRVAYTTNA